jgi:hypothetical protein
MEVQLDKINPQFRQLTDLLFFSDKLDLDLSEYKNLFKSNYNEHYAYVWDRFSKCSEIFWENGEKFWSHRLNFLLSLHDKNFSSDIETHLENRMFQLIKTKKHIHIKYDNEYLQFLELCKVKHSRHESLAHIKKQLTELPSHVRADKLMLIINSFIPLIFSNLSEYIDIVSRKITQSSRNFDLLKSLENQGFEIDKLPMVKLLKEILLEKTHVVKNRRAFFTMINDKDILDLFKLEYKNSLKKKIIVLLSQCEYTEIEENHLRNVKCLLEIDPSLADEMAVIYADKLYGRVTGHKRSNADRLIRLVKTFPIIVPKKLLAYLSAQNKMADIKYMLAAFPALKKLAAFV